MDRNKLWLIGAVIIIAGIIAGGWFIGIQPQLAASAAADAQRATVDAGNAQNEAVLVKLEKDYKSLPTLKEDLASLQKSVPMGSQTPSFVDELNALYPATGVTFVSLAVSDAQPYKSVAVTSSGGASTTTAQSGSTPTPTPSPTSGDAASTPAPTATAAPAAGAPPVTNALITDANFAAQPVSISVRGPYANVLNFVAGLQSGTRLFLVTNLSTTASVSASAAGSVDATVSGLIYSLVDTSGVEPAVATK